MSAVLTPAMLSLFAMMFACSGEEKRSSSSAIEQQSAESRSACRGPVLETMDGGGYTYVKVECGDRQVWAAGPKANIGLGEEVAIDQGMLMTKFHSPTLNRTFDELYFVSQFKATGKPAGAGV